MNSFIRRAAHGVERGVTDTLIQHWRKHRTFEEYYLGRLLAALEIDCVLDVGANIGQYGLMLREYSGYKGLIISFEPTPDAAKVLMRAASKDSRWEVRPFALGNTNGSATFQTMPHASVGNSFLELRQTDKPPISQIQVEVRRLGDLFPDLARQFGFSRPFLKMDTQGYDLEVFAGASEVIQKVIGLQSELSVEPFYEGAPGWQEAIATYQREGFVLSTMISNNTDWFPRLREIDCVMYRPDQYRPRS